MDYIIDHIPKSKSKRPGTKMSPLYITIHNNGNPKSTARNERNYLTNPNNTRSASFHIVVDEKEIIEAIPLDEVAYHSGNSAGNKTSISIEICESGNQAKVIEDATELIAKMLFDRDWETGRLRTHKNWSNKNCPRLLLPMWDAFVQGIDRKLGELKYNAIKPANAPKAEIVVSDFAKDAIEWAKVKNVSDGSRLKDFGTREEIITMIYRAMKEEK